MCASSRPTKQVHIIVAEAAKRWGVTGMPAENTADSCRLRVFRKSGDREGGAEQLQGTVLPTRSIRSALICPQGFLAEGAPRLGRL